MDGAILVVNPDFEEGMSTSIRAGLRAMDPLADGFLVVLADQPFVSSATMDTLIRRRAESGARIVIPTYRGMRGNPVLLARDLTAEALAITGDQGCRAIFGDHEAEILEVPVDDPGVVLDLDTEEQVARAQAAVARDEPVEAILAEVGGSGPHAHHEPRIAHRPRSHPRPDIPLIAHQLRAQDEPFAVATVVRAVRPTSGKPGAKAIIRAGHELVGWVGGSCAESAVIAESMKAIRDGRPRLLRLSREADPSRREEGVVEYVMECHSGGAMDIYIEPNLPRPRLVLVGDSPVVETLAAIGRILGYRIVIVAPGLPAEAIPEADEVHADLEALAAVVTPETYAVVAAMGKYDESALRTIVPSRARYVGFVASRRRASIVRDALRAKGVPADSVDRIQNPAGMDIAAHTPEEIALSIMAEVTRLRRSGEPAPPLHEVPPVPNAVAPMRDVVCGMEVETETPLATTYEGVTYRFCSDVCRSRFLATPAEFLL